jgi:hypothetical protein
VNSNAAVLDEAVEATPQHQRVQPLAPVPLVSFYARKALLTAHTPLARAYRQPRQPHEKNDES